MVANSLRKLVREIVLYLRLSKDDKNYHQESMSISNQRKIIEAYAEHNGLIIVGEYVDDGYTGTNFDRPAFKEMLKDAEMGKFDCIITKDLSRLGRNSIDTGAYIRRVFPELNLTYISINEGIDTANKDDDILTKLNVHNMMNEIYPAQVSKKVRDVKRANAAEGKFMGSRAPYGYQKSPTDKHLLIIDDESAVIVRRIFEELASGNTARAIADQLNLEKVDNPTFYYYRKTGKNCPFPEKVNYWGDSTIKQMIQNEAYIGNLVQNKRENVSFENSKKICVPTEFQTRADNTHEAIIEKDLWDRVHSMKKSHSRVGTPKTKTIGIFSGIIKCADCGSPLACSRKKLAHSEKNVYRCSKYNNGGKNACNTHYIEEYDLCKFILNDIKTYALLTKFDKKSIAERLFAAKHKRQLSETKVIQKQIDAAENKLATYSKALADLYMDKTMGNIPESVYTATMNQLISEQTELQEKLPQLKAEFECIKNTNDDIDSWIELVSNFANIETLTRAIAIELIDSIVVSDRVKVDGKWQQTIDINYRFVGELLKEADFGTKKENIA